MSNQHTYQSSAVYLHTSFDSSVVIRLDGKESSD